MTNSSTTPANPAQGASELIDEGLEILVNLIDNIKRHGNYSPESTCMFIDQASAAFRAALTAAIGAGGQAVAHQWRKRDRVMKHDENWSYVDYHTGLKIAEYPDKYEVRPLYTHPAPAVPDAVGAVGLTDSLIEKLVSDHGGPDYGVSTWKKHDELRSFARAIRAALVASRMPVGEGSAAPSGCAFDNDHLAWACERWQREVASRPLRNAHRRTLDDTWRQVIRRLGGDPDILLPMADHDTLVARAGEDGR